MTERPVNTDQEESFDIPSACLHELVEQQVHITPEAPAVIFHDSRMTYRELNSQANQLARYLISEGIQAESTVAVALPRSPQLIVTLLAVIKAGAAYLPLDRDYPADRIRFILEDAKPTCLITNGPMASLQTSGLKRIDLDALEDDDTLAHYAAGDLTTADRGYELTQHSAVYVIYTSGSTGRPKGVVATHLGAVNHMAWMAQTYPMHEDVVLMRTSMSSDAAGWELWVPLVSGAAVCMTPDEVSRDPTKLLRYMSKHQVSVAQFFPSLLANLPLWSPDCPLRLVFSGGEALSTELANRISRQWSVEVINLYGPTEATIQVTSWRCSPDDPPGWSPIGTPIWNTELHVLDADLKMVPPGIAGELWISGNSLTRGYLKNPTLTAQRFVSCPFSSSGQTMYRTGDLVRWNDSGALEILGRADDQVKVRPDSVTPKSHCYDPPQTPRERSLCELYAQVLGVDRVGLKENFYDLGGNSLLAMRLTNRLRVDLKVEVSVAKILEFPTVSTLVRALDSLVDVSTPELHPMRRPKQIPLSLAQERLWFLHKLEGNNPVYNMPLVVELSGSVSQNALRSAVTDVIHRHEMLRTTFQSTLDSPYQLVRENNDKRLFELYAYHQIDEYGLEKLLEEAISYPFDLTLELPLRVSLFDLGYGDYVLLLLVHHIAGDDLSLSILLRDLFHAYKARLQGEPPGWDPLPIQYADYALWQRMLFQHSSPARKRFTKQMAYWTQELAELPEYPGLPTDFPRPKVRSGTGDIFDFHLDAALHKNIIAVARNSNATSFMALHASVAALLTSVGAGTDIVVASPVDGRTDGSLERLIGFFLNTLTLRVNTSGDPTFRELLERVRDVNLGAYANRDVPFHYVVDAVNPARSLACNPLAQIAIVLQNLSNLDFDIPGLTVQDQIELHTGTAKFDLSFYFRELFSKEGEPDGIHGFVEFDVELFAPNTIQSYVSRLSHILRTLAEAPDTRVSDVVM